MELPLYENVASALTAAEAVISPSEVHGMLCGFICGGRDVDPQAWLKSLFGEVNVNAQALLDLHAYSVDRLIEMDFDFMILLPDDEQDLEVRAEALSTWCQGFVAGLGLADVKAEQLQQADVQEVLQSFSEVSRIDFSEVDTDEEDEQAYVELVEYTRMATLLVFGELAVQQEGGDASDSKVLH